MAVETLLVTGGSGFLASWCIASALEQGYRVRTTVRDLGKTDRVRAQLTATGATGADAVEVVAADLTADDGWDEAVEGCERVLHVASPFPRTDPIAENELIGPARDGTLRVLRAARDAEVRRIVVTSSFGAVGYGHPVTDRAFTEDDWTDVNGPGVSSYVTSKTLAERAAWDFIDREGSGMELSVINPVGIFGPVLGPDHSSSIELIAALLDGTVPAIPRISFAVIDVRDAADLHLRAATDPAAVGQRFIGAASDAIDYAHIAAVLRDRLGPAARRVPTRELAGEVGAVRHVSSAKAREILGWTPRSIEETITATAQSLLDHSLIGDRLPSTT